MSESLFPVTRRGFVVSVAGGMPGAALANQTVASRQSGDAPWDGPAVVKKVYLARYGADGGPMAATGGWPGRSVNIDQEIKEIDANLAQIEKRYPRRIHFVGGEVLLQRGGVPAWAQSLGDVDGILAVIVCSGAAADLEQIFALDKPTLVFERPYSGHDWQHPSRATQLGKKVDIVVSSDYEQLDPYADSFFTIHHLRKSKVLVVAPDQPQFKYGDTYTKQFGTAFAFHSYETLRTLIDKVDGNDAGRLADEVIKGAALVREPPREQTVLAARVHLAILELMRREKANAIAIDCISGHKDMGNGGYPCISFSKLNNEGQYGVCEGDIDSAMTMMLVTSFSGKPGFITDPVFDISDNEVIHAHCSAPTAMQGVGGPGFPYILRGYPYSGDIHATCVQVLFGGQGPITLAKFIDPQNFLVSTGEVMGNADIDRGCRSKMRTRVSDAHKLLRNFSLVNVAADQRPRGALRMASSTFESLHRVVFYGDHVEMIERLGRLTGFKVIHEL